MIDLVVSGDIDSLGDSMTDVWHRGSAREVESCKLTTGEEGEGGSCIKGSMGAVSEV